MDFDKRQEDWEDLLKIKAEMVDSFAKDDCCKVCMSLELLKLSVCEENCPVSDPLIVKKLAEGILEPESAEAVSEWLQSHLEQLPVLPSIYSKIESLEQDFKNHQEQLLPLTELDLAAQIDKIKNSLQNTENIPPVSSESIQKLETLEARINSYEESLSNLQKENEELRALLRKAVQLKEEVIDNSRKSSSELKNEVEHLHEEQKKLKAKVEAINRQVSENSENISQLKKERVENARESVENALQDLRRQKNSWVEEQKAAYESMQQSLEQVRNKSQNAEQRLEETWKRIEEMQQHQEKLEQWQKECKTLSRHTGHLLSAADSVFSSQQQFQDFQQLIAEKLEELKKELDQLKQENSQDKLQSSSQEYRAEVAGMRQAMNNLIEKYHPGKFEMDPSLGVVCWSCCKTNQSAPGCTPKSR